MLTVAARFSTLCNDNVRPGFQRRQGVDPAVHLTYQRHARRADAGGERARVAEGQHDRARLPFKHKVEDLRRTIERPGDESTSNWGVTGYVQFGDDPIAIAICATD